MIGRALCIPDNEVANFGLKIYRRVLPEESLIKIPAGSLWFAEAKNNHASTYLLLTHILSVNLKL
jgi:hypothetical protein